MLRAGKVWHFVPEEGSLEAWNVGGKTMKNKLADHLCRALVLGAITITGLSTTPANAQDWQGWETDDILAGSGGSHNDNIIQLADGSLLNAFFVYDGGERNKDQEWVVRWKPNETGANWQTVDHWSWQEGDVYLDKNPQSAASYFNEANNTIEVYVVGYVYSEVEVTTGKGKKKETSIQPQTHWTVRKGVLDSSGAWTWEIVRVFWNGLGSFNIASDVAVDPDGNVYVTGRSDDFWATEVSTDGGATWSVSDHWRYDYFNHTSRGTAITVGPDGAVYAVGLGGEWVLIPGSRKGRNKIPDTLVETSHWIVKRMDPNTKEWSVIDDYQGPDDDIYNSVAGAVMVTSDDILLVGGSSHVAADGSAGRIWTLRAFDEENNTWYTLDEFQPVPGVGNNYPTCITEGLDGTIYVGGKMYVEEPDPVTGELTYRYTTGIRSSTIDLLSWKNEEIFPRHTTGSLISMRSILATQRDSFGDSYLYVGDPGSEPDGVLVRKLIPSQ